MTGTHSTPPPFHRVGMWRLTWPLLVVTLVTLLATLGNVVVLSLASPELNAATATANQILGVLYDLSVLFSIGGLVVITQLLGAGSERRAARATVVLLRASTLLGLVICLGIGLLAPLLVRAIDTPAEITGDAVAYLWIVAPGMALNAYIVAATAVLRAYGRTLRILVLGLVVNLLDVALIATLVLVLDLGVVGAALPTLLIRGLGALLLSWFVRGAAGVHLLSRLPRDATECPSGAGAMARLSIPSVLENGAYNLVIVAAVSFINALGTEAINARSYALTLTALVTGITLAIAQGNETLVGWDVGERLLSAARRRTLRTALIAAGVAAVLAAGLLAGAGTLLAIFAPAPAVLESARTVLGLSILLLPLAAITAVLYGALRSAGDVTVPMAFSIGSTMLVLLPLSWLLVPVAGLGLAGAWWALIAAEAVKAVLLAARWRSRAWVPRHSIPEQEQQAHADGDGLPLVPP